MHLYFYIFLRFFFFLCTSLWLGYSNLTDFYTGLSNFFMHIVDNYPFHKLFASFHPFPDGLLYINMIKETAYNSQKQFDIYALAFYVVQCLKEVFCLYMRGLPPISLNSVGSVVEKHMQSIDRMHDWHRLHPWICFCCQSAIYRGKQLHRKSFEHNQS